ncbi:radical SAM/SPASM protein FxsBH, inactivated beta-hydroxylase extension form [Streptomyces sp. NPDC002845]
MTQIQELVLKIHSRCNLACDHCYMYEHADQSWKARPTVIAEETVTQVAGRLAAYADAHALERATVIFHGGEPLLVGPARLRYICEEITRILSPVTTVDLRMHTNGVLLRRHHLEILKEFDVKVGVSLDGDQAANDRHRLDRRGRSSYEKVLRGIELLRSPEYRHLYLGLLCTVDVTNDPVVTHDALTALDPPRIDYLLPHSTWDNPPPPGPSPSPTPYADWLLRIFDRWQEQGRPMRVRTFDSVLSTLHGGPSLTESLGLAPTDLAVVETDGTFEQADSLKAAYDGAPATGYDVFRNSFEEFARHPGVRARQLGIEGISDTCRRCPVVESCGGGLYAHRYSTERGFDNPSVFCADLRALVDGVAERLTDRTLAPAVHDPAELHYAQVELNRTLLAVRNEGASEGDWAEAWQRLLELDGDPRLDALLSHPYTSAALRSAEPLTAAWLAPLVIATAVRARTTVTLSWTHPDPALHLPTLGTLSLPSPGGGRVEVTVDGHGFRVRQGEDALHVRYDDHDDYDYDYEGTPHRWRPLPASVPLVDDADPHRAACYPAPVYAPLDPSGLRVFRKRLARAYELLDERRPGWRDDPRLLAITTVTPLEYGRGVHLGEHAPGALGVAVDIEPEDLVRHLPRLARRARLMALRETADLTLLGSRAGQLIDRASELVADARSADAHGVLTELAALPERELTETGAACVEQLWEEWRGRDGRS